MFGIDPALLKAISDAGGWVVSCAILIGVIVAIIHGDLVPGREHRREIARANRATDQLERQAEVGEQNAKDLRLLLDLLKGILPKAQA